MHSFLQGDMKILKTLCSVVTRKKPERNVGIFFFMLERLLFAVKIVIILYIFFGGNQNVKFIIIYSLQKHLEARKTSRNIINSPNLPFFSQKLN